MTRQRRFTLLLERSTPTHAKQRREPREGQSLEDVCMTIRCWFTLPEPRRGGAGSQAELGERHGSENGLAIGRFIRVNGHQPALKLTALPTTRQQQPSSGSKIAGNPKMNDGLRFMLQDQGRVKNPTASSVLSSEHHFQSVWEYSLARRST